MSKRPRVVCSNFSPSYLRRDENLRMSVVGHAGCRYQLHDTDDFFVHRGAAHTMCVSCERTVLNSRKALPVAQAGLQIASRLRLKSEAVSAGEQNDGQSIVRDTCENPPGPSSAEKAFLSLSLSPKFSVLVVRKNLRADSFATCEFLSGPCALEPWWEVHQCAIFKH